MLFGCSKDTKIETDLNNKNSTIETIRLYNYLKSVYGDKVISGQQESTWTSDGSEYEMEYIHDLTGKYPAIRGLDFMNDDFDGVVERAIAWHKRGGIVTICWHCGKNFTGNYTDCKEDEITNWDEVLTEGTEANRLFTENMDHAGAALKQLQDAKVPVLWRPFHEFDGQWFWWGKGGEDNFKKLWIYMYNHFTNDLGLNNLIWVLGYSHNGMASNIRKWYPGDNYCDIAGADTYEVDINGGEMRLYRALKAGINEVNGANKMFVMHECGLIPTIDDFKEVRWGYFMTWHTEWLIDTNSTQHLIDIYQDDYVITLDELPDFSKVKV